MRTVMLVVLAMVLAGCGEKAPTPETTTTFTRDEGAIRDFEDPEHDCVAKRDPDRVHAPDLEGNPWRIGQTWDYSLAIDGGEAKTTRLIYYGDQDQGAHYMIGTQTREEALLHALYSINPMIGRIHAFLYSPHESGDHADMFHFPLCDGSTWSTVFYGETFTLTARTGDVDVPGLGPREGFIIQGTSPEGSRLELTYSLDAQWFTYIDLDRQGGSVDMRLVALGDGYTGSAYFLRGQKDAVVDLGEAFVVVNQTVVSREDGNDGAYDTLGIALDVAASGPGHARVELAAPNGTVMLSVEVGTVAGAETASLVTEVPYAAGDWTLTRISVPPVVGPTLTGELRVVSIYDRSGVV